VEDLEGQGGRRLLMLPAWPGCQSAPRKRKAQ
jgi:hypothetical protein